MHAEILFLFFLSYSLGLPFNRCGFPQMLYKATHTHIRTRKREEGNEGKVCVCVC